MKNKILPYTQKARRLSKILRNNMTSSEKIFWEQIRKKQLGVQFNRQFPILEYVVDFYAKEIGLVVEVDGEVHQDNVLEDGIRQHRLEELGLRFFRVTNEDIIENLDDVISQIKCLVEELS